MIVCLGLLSWVLVLINMNIVSMVLGLIRAHFFHYQMVNRVKILLLLIIKKYFLSLGEGQTQELDDATTTVEVKYSVNITHKMQVITFSKLVM